MRATQLGFRTGFNEAAAEWPRESMPSASGSAASESFNEAAAEWPRESNALCTN